MCWAARCHPPFQPCTQSPALTPPPPEILPCTCSEQMRCRHKNIYDMRSALRWAGQIASALSALHEQQPPYVHNDVKADNVFLTDAPRFLDVEDAKLGDLKPHRWELSKRG